ncbi:hypothetical protein [Streptomyces sp. GC420]|uniref:hypothetical protein n=1 Tax=Streptomyces sp. GC420 TaxID=2697568 RepID=UPI001414F644|nr:hypothetical protein [Streptomyces sp. GC420]NBM18472.1 hypothetical protein [Streptomyces sp. GC420]
MPGPGDPAERGGPDEVVRRTGPFATRRSWHLADGGSAVWESRQARRRGTLTVRPADGTGASTRRADETALRRLRLLNTVAAVAFTVGGGMFTLGAALALSERGGTAGSASVYFAGGLFFNTGGYASLLQEINAPRHRTGRASLAVPPWRWWSYEPDRIGWLSTFTLFAGTLVFGVNLLNSFLTGLSAQQADRLIWAPDMIGCPLFLISGALGLAEVCHGRPWLRPRSLGWWIVAVNESGSVLFLVAALAAFTRPATGSPVNAVVADWGTLTGALCFSLGGVLQALERP